MHIALFRSPILDPGKRHHGFTLVEVVITLAIVALVIGGIIYAYVMAAQRAEWSAYSLAAHSVAMQSLEQSRAAKWDPQAWPVVDEQGLTNFIQIEPLDVPVAGTPIFATNFVQITQVSANPPLRQIRADCVWPFVTRGTFTNTVITLRAPDQ
jgi:prepilin-type N-terminal cleavage/methylation domain-containing protein